jgi:hypothetical protein
LPTSEVDLIYTANAKSSDHTRILYSLSSL